GPDKSGTLANVKSSTLYHRPNHFNAYFPIFLLLPLTFAVLRLSVWLALVAKWFNQRTHFLAASMTDIYTSVSVEHTICSLFAILIATTSLECLFDMVIKQLGIVYLRTPFQAKWS